MKARRAHVSAAFSAGPSSVTWTRDTDECFSTPRNNSREKKTQEKSKPGSPFYLSIVVDELEQEPGKPAAEPPVPQRRYPEAPIQAPVVRGHPRKGPAQGARLRSELPSCSTVKDTAKAHTSGRGIFERPTSKAHTDRGREGARKRQKSEIAPRRTTNRYETNNNHGQRIDTSTVDR